MKYIIDSNDIDSFENNLIKVIRFTYTTLEGNKHEDLTIKSKDAKKLEKTYKMFIDEVNKNATE